MLGLGWSEMLVIAVVMLIVVGPKDLPAMLRTIGRTVGSIRRMGDDFRREIDKAIAADEIKEAKKAISDPLKQTSRDINREFNSIRNGKVEPSGKLKPSEEGKESVVDEIRSRAGMKSAAKTGVPADAATAPEEQAQPLAQDVASRPRVTVQPQAASAAAVASAKSSAPKTKAAPGGKAAAKTGTKAKSAGASNTPPKAAGKTTANKSTASKAATGSSKSGTSASSKPKTTKSTGASTATSRKRTSKPKPANAESGGEG